MAGQLHSTEVPADDKQAAHMPTPRDDERAEEYSVYAFRSAYILTVAATSGLAVLLVSLAIATRGAQPKYPIAAVSASSGSSASAASRLRRMRANSSSFP